MTKTSSPLRVAHVAWGYLGGGVDSVLDSYLAADRLRPGEVVSHVVIVRNPGAKPQKVPRAGVGYDIVSRSSRELLLAGRETARQLQAFGPDIVLLHGFNATILGFALHRHLPPGLAILSSYHGTYYARSPIARVKAALFNRLERRFFRAHAAAVIAVSHHSAALLEAHRLPKEKIIVLHNAVERGSPPILPKTHSDADGKRRPVKIVTVSRLAPQKGINVLLQAFASLAADFPLATLDIVGDGPLRTELTLLAEAMGVSETVRFLGNRNNVAELLGSADIFAMTSRQEDHSVSILEAMRAGLPPVVTEVGGNGESVRDGQDGFLVPDLDTKAAADAMARLIESGELRARFGSSARARYEEKFETTVMISRFLTVLIRLVRDQKEGTLG